jgi:hypothetical protein
MQEIIDYGREQMNFSSLIKLWSYVNDEILSCMERNLDHMNPDNDILGKQVEEQWTTLEQVYVDYPKKVRIGSLQSSLSLTCNPV